MIQVVCKSLRVVRFPVATSVIVGLLAITCGVCCVMFPIPELARLQWGNTSDLTPSVSKNLVFPVAIEARGRHFEWTFRYPGRDGILNTNDDLLVEKELHLPVGVDVELKLESDDFIYILYNPERGLKQIAVPELSYSIELHTTKAETFDLRTDPLCGWRPLHDDLMGRVIIESTKEFDEWFDKASSSPALRQ